METSGHLIVDGHNILHAWKWVRAGKRVSPDLVRRLLDYLLVIHDIENRALTLVVDGAGTGLQIEHPDHRETVTLVYASSELTADGVIERLLARAPDTDQWVVATADVALIQSAHTCGADAISPDHLERWVEDASRRQSEFLKRQSNKVDREWRSG